MSLTRKESDARDQTQQTFWLCARKGHQLQDPAKVKSWLFTTLHREFLQGQRRSTRFPHHEVEDVPEEIPSVPSTMVNDLDSGIILECLGRIDPLFQAPLALFYLEDHSYQEIADVLGIPLGTVKSRIARGIAQLQNAVMERQKGRRP